MADSLILDVETTIKNKGHPFTPSNKLCCVGIGYERDSPIVTPIEYNDEPYGDNLNTIQKFVDLADVLVGFNFKFDLHWLRRYGINFSDKRVWDCQLAQFIIECQLSPYPSLNESCAFWGIQQKYDVVEEEYWSKGIDTPDVPWDILETYTAQDIKITKDLMDAQLAYLADKPKMQKIIELACADLLILQEMEYNGILYDVEESHKQADVLKDRAKEITANLSKLVGRDDINWNSPDQISAVLYGGTINFVRKALVPFTYKDGRTTQKLRNVEEKVVFPRLVEPLPKTELKKHGFWSTSESVLRDLRTNGIAEKVVEGVLELSDIDKQVGTYLEGIPKKIVEYEWANNTIHGQLNQCVAVTGRLSSSNPNLQNNPHSIDLLFRSRYAD